MPYKKLQWDAVLLFLPVPLSLRHLGNLQTEFRLPSWKSKCQFFFILRISNGNIQKVISRRQLIVLCWSVKRDVLQVHSLSCACCGIRECMYCQWNYTGSLLEYKHEELDQLAEQVIRAQTSLTGVQPKLSLNLDKHDGCSRLTIVGLWGDYIFKPQAESYERLPENEDLTM